MAVPLFRLVLGCMFVFAARGAAAAQDPASCGGTPVSARITEALDGTSLRLEDGRVVRLVNVMAPMPIDGDRAALLRAKRLLAEIAGGKEASLFFLSEAKDRYGRLSAQAVLLEGTTWLEAELLSRGIVRAVPSPHDRCMTALLQFEAKAREARSGFWSEPQFAVLDAEDLKVLRAAEGRYAVVEGRVRRVGESRGRLYLDFGRRFTEDFTIIIPPAVQKALLTQGVEPKRWRGKRIRVRGVLFSWGGPAIEANVAQAIELLD